jgi:Holliday junction DNA helicase RuvB
MSDTRPQKLENFVGQQHMLSELKVALSSSLKRSSSFPHTLMFGPPGLGKTTLAGIIANEMSVPFVSVMGTNIKTCEDLEALLVKIPRKGHDEYGKKIPGEEIVPTVIFIDEIDNLKMSIMTLLHSVLEDGQITLRRRKEGVVQDVKCWIPSFTLIGATNYMGTLPKPLSDRFKITLRFEAYDNEDIEKVIRFSAEQLGSHIDDDAVNILAERSRGVPRLANSFLDATIAVSYANDREGVITLEDVNEMFSMKHVDCLGLTLLDRQVLKYLSGLSKPVGLKSVSQAVDEDAKTVENTIEPWLLRQGLIIRTPQGREITDEGRQHLGREQGMDEMVLPEIPMRGY